MRVCKSIVSDNPAMKNVKQKVPGYSDLHWRWYGLDDMKPALLYDLLALREAIFVVEQSCIYHELDGLDKTARHLLLTQKEEVVACLRVLPPAVNGGNVRIGRVAVCLRWRKRGLARTMLENAIEKIRQRHPSSGIYLDAQTYLQPFYSSIGFQVCGEEFLDEGIAHIPMKMKKVFLK